MHFAIILYLLTHWKHMTNFENINILFELMKVKHCPKNIGVTILVWECLKFYTIVVMQTIEFVVHKLIMSLCFMMKWN